MTRTDAAPHHVADQRCHNAASQRTDNVDLKYYSRTPSLQRRVRAKFHGSSLLRNFLVADVTRKSLTFYEDVVRVGRVTRMPRGCYEEVTVLSRVPGLSLACHENVTMLRGSYEKTAPVEFSLYRSLPVVRFEHVLSPVITTVAELVRLL